MREGGDLHENLNAQLKEALALESERVAKAWSQRERLREEVQQRDTQLAAAQAELFQLHEQVHAQNDELAQLRELRALGEVGEQLRVE